MLCALGIYAPKDCISSIDNIHRYIDTFVGSRVNSPALNAKVAITKVTKDHLLDRSLSDTIRRVNMFGDAIEILEKSDKVHAISITTDGITYYEILGKSNKGIIMNVKVSEMNNDGKILWTIIDVK